MSRVMRLAPRSLSRLGPLRPSLSRRHATKAESRAQRRVGRKALGDARRTPCPLRGHRAGGRIEAAMGPRRTPARSEPATRTLQGLYSDSGVAPGTFAGRKTGCPRPPPARRPSAVAVARALQPRCRRWNETAVGGDRRRASQVPRAAMRRAFHGQAPPTSLPAGAVTDLISRADERAMVGWPTGGVRPGGAVFRPDADSHGRPVVPCRGQPATALRYGGRQWTRGSCGS